MSKRKMPFKRIEDITEAIEMLEALVDPKNKNRCGVDPKHKEAVRIYIESWVLPRLKKLKHWSLGGKFNYGDIPADEDGNTIYGWEDL
jgi:hypothetical protein